MPNLEILRSEGANLPGYIRKVIALPLARIDLYSSNGSLIVLDTDFELNEFEPPLVVIEATNKTVELSTKHIESGAGVAINIDLTLSFPGDERTTGEKFLKLEALKYFVVFVQDMNKTESDYKWKVLGSKEEPMVFSSSFDSNPKKSTIKFKGMVTEQIPWYDPEANPETDLE
jgi:hypothetical protein